MYVQSMIQMDNETYDRMVAENVKAALETAGVSIKAASDTTGIPYVTLHRKVNGKPFYLSELRALSTVVGVPVEALLPVVAA